MVNTKEKAPVGGTLCALEGLAQHLLMEGRKETLGGLGSPLLLLCLAKLYLHPSGDFPTVSGDFPTAASCSPLLCQGLSVAAGSVYTDASMSQGLGQEAPLN